MRALYIERYGHWQDVAVSDVARPSAGPGQVLVQVDAAGINPSDVGSIESKFAHVKLPRVVGRDFAGRMVVYSVLAGREAALDLFLFYRKAISLHGLNTADLDAAACARRLDKLAPMFDSRALQPPTVAERFPLSQAGKALARFAEGPRGKVVLLPGS